MSKPKAVKLWTEKPDRLVYEEAVNRMAEFDGVVFKAVPKHPYTATLGHYMATVGGYLVSVPGRTNLATAYNMVVLDMSDIHNPVKVNQKVATDLESAIACAVDMLQEAYAKTERKQSCRYPEKIQMAKAPERIRGQIQQGG